ncbi:MAG: head-tail connector protein [Terrimicrobiaceae bacterium]
MTIKVITAPVFEPITLAEAKLHLRVDTTDDDALISALIVAAREEIERRSWHALMTQTLELVLDEWPCDDEIVLPRPPLQSVTSFTYKDASGTVNTWDPAHYVVGVDTVPAEIEPAYGKYWPATALHPVDAIRIRYVCGFASASAVPQSLKQAMLLCMGRWYENREGEVPYVVDMLCQSFRHQVREF